MANIHELKLCKDGLYNVAAAMLCAMGRDYLNARRMNILQPSRRAAEMVMRYREEILTTRWNLTPLTNEELLRKIELDGIAEIGTRKEQNYA